MNNLWSQQIYATYRLNCVIVPYLVSPPFSLYSHLFVCGFFFCPVITEDDFERADLARALVGLCASEVSHVTYWAAKASQCKRVFFCGGFLEHSVMQEEITKSFLTHSLFHSDTVSKLGRSSVSLFVLTCASRFIHCSSYNYVHTAETFVFTGSDIYLQGAFHRGTFKKNPKFCINIHIRMMKARAILLMAQRGFQREKKYLT